MKCFLCHRACASVVREDLLLHFTTLLVVFGFSFVSKTKFASGGSDTYRPCVITAPPRTLIMDFTMTHVRFGRSHVITPYGSTYSHRRLDGVPDPDGTLKEVVRIKIRHYHNLYSNRPDPIPFLPVEVETSVRLYDDFIGLIFLKTHSETSALTDELPEESDHCRFLRSVCFVIPLPRFIRSRRALPNQHILSVSFSFH